MGRISVPSTYAGVCFRSRLHATWAAFFDVVGWAWEYEAEDFHGFAPAFRLEFHRPLYVVVDPGATPWREPRAFAIADALAIPRLLVVADSAIWRSVDDPVLGSLMSESTHGMRDGATFCLCTVCGQYSVCPEVQTFDCQVCGEYDAGANFEGLSGAFLQSLWRRALTYGPGARLAPYRHGRPPHPAPYDPFAEEPGPT